MDEETFSRELSRLKELVTLMPAATSQLSPSTRPPGRHDHFDMQLHDIKSRLDSLQISVEAHASQPTHQQKDITKPEMAELVTPFPQRNHLSLPSGPIFWELFSALRTDVRGLDRRLATLEETVSELEDRVDGMHPCQFTPASTESGASNHACEQIPSAFMSNAMPVHYDPNDPFRNFSELDSSESNPQIGTAAKGRLVDPFAHWGLPLDSNTFRDREIARLEELLRTAHERLNVSESVLAVRDQEITNLRQEQREFDERILQLHRVLHHLLMDKDAKIADLETEQLSARQVVQQSLRQRESELFASYTNDAQSPRQNIDVRRVSRDRAMDRMLTSRNEEIERLRDFCEQKNAVIRQQEEVIARGASLLEERDNELKQTDQSLKIQRDDITSIARERDRIARLLQERDEQIVQLKASHEEHRPDSWFWQMPDDQPQEPAMDNSEPFASHDANRWSPRPVPKGSTSFPRDASPVFTWESPNVVVKLPQPDVPNNHSPSPRALRRSNSLRLLSRLSAVEAGTNHAPAHRMPPGRVRRSSPPPRRQRLDDDHPTFPSPIASRRPRSSAELSHLATQFDGDHSHVQRRISNRQSMQALPRRMQAYVEDEISGRSDV